MSQIKPLSNRILVKRKKAELSKGKILLPDSVQEKPKIGEVVAVGPGKFNDEGERIALSVKVGDQVLFGAYAGVEVKSDSQEEAFLVMAEDEVLGIIG
jgi:chaperonin GroES